MQSRTGDRRGSPHPLRAFPELACALAPVVFANLAILAVGCLATRLLLAIADWLTGAGTNDLFTLLFDPTAWPTAWSVAPIVLVSCILGPCLEMPADGISRRVGRMKKS